MKLDLKEFKDSELRPIVYEKHVYLILFLFFIRCCTANVKNTRTCESIYIAGTLYRCNTWRDRSVRAGALKNYEKYVFARYMLPRTSVIDFRT